MWHVTKWNLKTNITPPYLTCKNDRDFSFPLLSCSQIHNEKSTQRKKYTMINCFCRWADWAGGRLIPGLPAHPNEPFICFPRYLPQLHLSTSSRHRRRRRGSPPLLPSPPPPPPQKLGSSRRECLMAAASIPASSQPFKVRGPAAAPPIKLICSLFEELSLIWSVRLGDNGGGDCYTRCGSSQLILGSSSVARKHILTEMGLEFEVMVGCGAFLPFCIFPPFWGDCLLSGMFSWGWNDFCGFRLQISTRRASGGRTLTR